MTSQRAAVCCRVSTGETCLDLHSATHVVRAPRRCHAPPEVQNFVPRACSWCFLALIRPPPFIFDSCPQTPKNHVFLKNRRIDARRCSATICRFSNNWWFLADFSLESLVRMQPTKGCHNPHKTQKYDQKVVVVNTQCQNELLI